MSNRNIERNQRSHDRDKGAPIPVEITDVNFDGEPTVTLKPMQSTKSLGFDGEVEELDGLEIFEVPYNYPSSGSFAMFVPPEIGQQGFFIPTNFEVGEVGDGKVTTSRVRDKASGFFVPTGSADGKKPFKGNKDWAEMRSGSARIAMSKDSLHMQNANVDVTFSPDGFDVVSNGVSMVDALHEMSQHIKDLEAIVSSVRPKQVDNYVKAIPPTRSESGVR